MQDRLINRVNRRIGKVSLSLEIERKKQSRKRRRDREGRDHGADERIGIGFCHRRENMSGDAAEAEQWHEGADDDRRRKEDRYADFAGRRMDDGKSAREPVIGDLVQEPPIRARSGMSALDETPENILDHQHGAIDDQAEVDRADGKKIGGTCREAS